MGHLVNASGLRLGWTTIWQNYWFTDLKFGYSNFIFICSRLRAFLRFFFLNRAMDKSFFIFSHFEIIKVLKHLNIKIYFYFNSVLSFVPKIFKRTWRVMRQWRKRYYRGLYSHLVKMRHSDNIKNWWDTEKKKIPSYQQWFNNSIKTKNKVKQRLLKLPALRRKLVIRRLRLVKGTSFRYKLLKRFKRNNLINPKYFVIKYPQMLLSSLSLANQLKFINNKILPISDYKIYLKQYPISFGGSWWDLSTAKAKRLNDDSVWLFFKANQRDISILKCLNWNDIFKKNYCSWLLKMLIRILNKRESQLDYVLDGIKNTSNKFSLKRLEFIDALLENLYNSVNLSRKQRVLRKMQLTIGELIVAVIYAFRCQKPFFKIWKEIPYSWFRSLTRKGKIYIYNLYYNFWKGFAYDENLSSLNEKFIGFSKKQRFVRSFFGGDRFKHLTKIRLFRKFNKIFSSKRAHFIFKGRLFSATLLLLLNAAAYRNNTFFDMSYFNVLMRALKSANINLLRKFFLFVDVQQVVCYYGQICANIFYYLCFYILINLVYHFLKNHVV